MKTMKLMVCLVVLFCATTLMAQQPRGGMGGMMSGTPAERAERMAVMLKTRLDLNNDQVKQAQAIYLNYFTKEAALQAEREASIDKLLTPDQLKKMQEARTQMQQRSQGGSGKQGKAPNAK